MADYRYDRFYSLRDISPGDQVAFKMKEGMFGYYHHAIVEFVNYDLQTLNVIEKLYEGIDRGVYGLHEVQWYEIWNPQRTYYGMDAVRRARSRLYKEGFDMQHDNCEHFAEWRVTGQSRSYQIENLPIGAGLVIPMLRKHNRKRVSVQQKRQESSICAIQ